MHSVIANHLAVFVLGKFSVRLSGAIIMDALWPHTKSAAILKLLAVTPGHILDRRRITDAVWPDLSPGAAANNLRKNLHLLRRLFAEHGYQGNPIQSSGSLLSLHPDVWIDLDEFTILTHAALEDRDCPDTFDRAIRSYAGDLLPEDERREWSQPYREAIKGDYRRLLNDAAYCYERSGRCDLAVATLESLAASDRLDELVCQRLMMLDASMGNRSRAVRRYRDLREALAADLEAEPDPATDRVYAQISNLVTRER